MPRRNERVVVPDDIAEARQVRAETRADLARLRRTAPLIDRLAGRIIDRQGKNHYIELLYQHAPKGAS